MSTPPSSEGSVVAVRGVGVYCGDLKRTVVNFDVSLLSVEVSG